MSAMIAACVAEESYQRRHHEHVEFKKTNNGLEFEEISVKPTWLRRFINWLHF